MPSFLDMQRRYQNSTVGQQLKEMSDFAMQETWDNDIQTRPCFIYDYSMDDNIELLEGYDPSKNKDKIPVSLKFIIKTYKSASKDDPEYHIQFEPNYWNNLEVPDWFKEKYQRFGVKFPVGLKIVPYGRNIISKPFEMLGSLVNSFTYYNVMMKYA